MNAPNESNDPLSPVYPTSSGGAPPVSKERMVNVRARNIASLVVLVFAVLLLIFFMARDKAAPLPPATEQPTVK